MKKTREELLKELELAKSIMILLSASFGTPDVFNYLDTQEECDYLDKVIMEQTKR